MSTSQQDDGARPSALVRLLDQALVGGPEVRTVHRVRAGVVLLGVLVLLVIAVPVVISRVGRDDVELAVGVVFVVVLGAGGLVCRGVGEHRSSQVWKSTGYFLGAAAYGASATVALVNGLHTLLRGS
ncbi:hypothetical protein [Cellulomonas wangsupingiae]|uniref:Transmembrane protein n=1 Tax=Cellulomonas wangsupingiae TaxID=2968085 RepID=A0ABY5K079_9CELL|nr:hypothetical protein [Cellulomonas wangsupingiae]MCC2333557.1 hypothetical protein [Cellulomonas wangsupingiae]MCM0638407.1 hypothetical protein [Cellulomonas wangsupingiae]UUI63740.1 hypothetical protein NP075_11340 [Cellulomonas wangsupingiae]